MRRSVGLSMAVCLLLICAYLAGRLPRVLAAEDEASVLQMERPVLSGLSVPDAFARLKADEFAFDESSLTQGIHEAFDKRKEQAIALAFNVLRIPRVMVVEGRRFNRSDDLHLAKKIFQEYAADSLMVLERDYHSGDAVLRGNIIQMIGGLDQGPQIRQFLVEALDDQASCEIESRQDEGMPLRVCDAAYNQLVLFWQIKDVLRAIGNSHRIDIRDYHIQLLKSRLTGVPVLSEGLK